MKINATPEDFKPGALLEKKLTGEKVRIVEQVRDDEFTSIHEGSPGVDITEFSCYADYYYILEHDENWDKK